MDGARAHTIPRIIYLWKIYHNPQAHTHTHTLAERERQKMPMMAKAVISNQMDGIPFHLYNKHSTYLSLRPMWSFAI